MNYHRALADRVKREVEATREYHAKLVLQHQLKNRDWMTKSEYLRYLKQNHRQLYEATMKLLAPDEALEGRAGPEAPDPVIALTMSRRPCRRWRRNVLMRTPQLSSKAQLSSPVTEAEGNVQVSQDDREMALG